MKNKESLWNTWDTIKRDNLCITEVPAEEEREKEIKISFKEIMAENSKLRGSFGQDIHVYEANR